MARSLQARGRLLPRKTKRFPWSRSLRRGCNARSIGEPGPKSASLGICPRAARRNTKETILRSLRRKNAANRLWGSTLAFRASSRAIRARCSIRAKTTVWSTAKIYASTCGRNAATTAREKTNRVWQSAPMNLPSAIVNATESAGKHD